MKFKPEDFNRFLYHPENKEHLANYVNARIEEHLKSQTRLYGKKCNSKAFGDEINFGSNKQSNAHAHDTHEAIVWDIKERQ